MVKTTASDSERSDGQPVTPAQDDVDRAIALVAYALDGVIADLAASGVDEIPRAFASARAAGERAHDAGAPRSEAPRRPSTTSPRTDDGPAASSTSPTREPVRADVTRAPPVVDTTRVVASARAASIELVAAPQAEMPRATAPVPTAEPALPVDETSARIKALLSSTTLGQRERLAVLQDDIVGACTRCKLHRGRTRLVFGVGNPRAELVFVGEGPGAEEDRQGVPFVGRAGELLTKMIEAMQFSRDDVYIMNVVKCRPPNNRDPEPDEIASCEPFLKAQLAIIRPKVIVTLGRYATQSLLQTGAPIGALRGRWFQYEGVDLMPTFHPSYLLRSPEKKRDTWADLKQVMRHFGRDASPR